MLYIPFYGQKKGSTSGAYLTGRWNLPGQAHPNSKMAMFQFAYGRWLNTFMQASYAHKSRFTTSIEQGVKPVAIVLFRPLLCTYFFFVCVCVFCGGDIRKCHTGFGQVAAPTDFKSKTHICEHTETLLSCL